MEWDFTHLGVYPMQQKGVFGIFAHPLVHSSFKHLFANTIPFFFLSWCLFYFYRGIAPYIFFTIWIGCGLLTFLIGKPGWHIGASGIIYGLAFFLFFSGLLRKHIPLIAISLLITFLYGGLVWNMFPQFAKADTSWEGHLGGAITGFLCSIAFINHGPHKTDPFANEDEEDKRNKKRANGQETEPLLFHNGRCNQNRQDKDKKIGKASVDAGKDHIGGFKAVYLEFQIGGDVVECRLEQIGVADERDDKSRDAS